MRFTRFPRHREQVDPSPRRLAAARRWVEKDQDKVALFPELARYQTPEERLQKQDEGFAWFWQEQRDFRARTWREARARLRALPPIRQAGLRAYWARCGHPGDGVYLLSMVREAEHITGNFWGKLAHIRRLQLVGQGRLPKHLVFKKVVRKPHQ